MITKLRWGILSTAKIGRNAVIPATQASTRGEVVAIASRDGTRARAVAGELNIASAYGSYEELLADPEVDAIYNPLPNHLHAPMSIAAARAGKHVLCEKPLAMSAQEARQMVDVFAQEGVVFMEAFMYRLHPQWKQVRDLVTEGRIGEVRAVHSWFSYNNTDPDNIRNVAEFGGGAVMDIGCYCINVARTLFAAEPETVTSTVTRDERFGIDTLTSATLRFESGHASFTCSTQMQDHQTVVIFGTDGRIEVEKPFNPLEADRNRILVTDRGEQPGASTTQAIEVPASNQYTAQADAFAAVVLDGAEMPIANEDSVANMEVIEAVLAG